MHIHEIVQAQRDYFLAGRTRSYAFRRESLQRMRRYILKREADILSALKADLNKPEYEGYMTETGIALNELEHAARRLKKWMRPVKARTPMAQFPAKSLIIPEPYGVALIMSPWNYPFQLSVTPLIGAIAAGNCAVVKPSAYAPHTSRIIAELIGECFAPEHITAVEGGRGENSALLEERFDYIFFTGGISVGKKVMEAAARSLTPLSLELGGKSPCIVWADADIDSAARRIAFGKCLNAGQTCVAPDYLLVHERVKDELISSISAAFRDFFSGAYEEIPVIINDRHFERLQNLMRGERIVFGGSCDRERRFIEPTILDNPSWESPVMNEEIFGPILPVIAFSDLDEAIKTVRSRPKPLALYLFTRDKKVEQKALDEISFGGGCVNDTVMHLATPYMGFGGVGESGMGSYHGKKSFDTFTHYKSMLIRRNRFDWPLRYRPYTEGKLKWLRRFMG